MLHTQGRMRVIETPEPVQGSTPISADPDTPCPASRRVDLPTLAVLLGLGGIAALWMSHVHGWGRLDLPVSHVRGSDWDVQLTLVEAGARSWAAGELPLWNPWTAGGVPLWANPEAPVFHPITWAAMWVHPATVARVVLIAHVALQVIGTGLLARVLGARRATLPVVAVALLTTDVLMWRLAHGHLMMAQAAWIPWCMAAVLGLRSPTRAGAVGALVVAAAVHGGGHYPAWIALASTGLLVTVVRLCERRSPVRDRGIDLGVRLGTLAVVTGLLAAPRWLPTARALADTPRLRGPQAPLAMGDFSLLEAVQQVFAGAFAPLVDFPGLHEGLPGWGTPVVAVLALVALGRSASSDRAVRVGAGLSVLLFAAVSLGHNLPGNAYAWLHAVPPLDRFRNPERWAMAWAPLLAALAAVGCTVGLEQVRTRWARAVVGLGLMGGLAGHAVLALPATWAHTGIDQITPDDYHRAPRQPPVAVWEPRLTNFEGAGRSQACLACSDALLHEAPAELPEGPYALAGPAELREWRPDRVRFYVPVDPTADPRAPMDTEVVLPQAFRTGWTARDDAGRSLRLSADPAGTRVEVPTPGRVVEVVYEPPGFELARGLGAVGGVLCLVALVSRRTGRAATS